MSRNILVSLGIIFLLGLYILISKIDWSGDVLKLDQWDGSAEEIIIQKNQDVVHLQKKDDGWLIGENGYPANSKLVEDMEKKARELQVDSLVSDRGFYVKYDLTKEKSIDVVIKKDGKLLRKLQIGKKGSTGKHTYVRIDDRPEIFMASGTFDNVFNKSIDDLREKEIFKVQKEGVDSFQIAYFGRSFTFLKEFIEKSIDKNQKDDKNNKEGNVPDESKKEEIWKCKGYDSVKLNKGRVESLLSTLNPLRASSFSDIKKETLKNPVSVININAYGKEIVLNIYGKKDGDRYLATSSESPYVFTLDEWRAKKFFIRNLDDLREK